MSNWPLPAKRPVTVALPVLRYSDGIKRLPKEGLADRSKRPKRLARQKWADDTINLILDIRDIHRFGKIRICSHLWQHHQIKISPSTVARVLEKYDMKLLKRYRKQLDLPTM